MGDYWEENGIEKPQAVVVCAACRPDKYSKLILCGARHWDGAMREQLEALQYHMRLNVAKWEQGFINQFGEFLTREEAMIIAVSAGQDVDIKRGCGGDSETLYSEGLY